MNIVMAKVVSNEECRACLRELDGEACQNLFQEWYTSWAAPGTLISDFLCKFADIEISPYDRHSKVICPECFSRLADACSFMKSVQRSDSILRKRGDNAPLTGPDIEMRTASWPKPIILDKNLNGSVDHTISTSIEIKQETLSEDEYGSSHADQDWEPTMDIKIEPEEIMAPVTSDVTLNGACPQKKTNVVDSSCSYEEEYLDNTIKEEPLSENDQDAALDLPLECILCMKKFHSIRGLKAHVISQHSYGTVMRKTDNSMEQASNNKEDNKFVCATCRLKFTTRTDLMVHEASHSKHVCFVCNAKFKKFKQLTRHRSRCRLKSSNQNAKPPCRKLPAQSKHSSTEKQKEAIGKPTITEPSTAEIKVEITIGPSLKKIEENNTNDRLTPTIVPEPTDSKPSEVINKNKEELEHSDVIMVETKEQNICLQSSLIDSSNSKNNLQETVDIPCTNSQKELNLATVLEEPNRAIVHEEINLALIQEEPNCATVREEINLASIHEKLNRTTVQEEINLASIQEEPNRAILQQQNLANAQDNILTAQNTKIETCVKPKSDETLSNENEAYSNQSEKSISNMDELNQNMKVHLAINPLNEDGRIVLEKKMDVDAIDKSEVRCKLRLVDISILTEKK